MTHPILKPAWKTVKFGNVVSLNRDRVADSTAKGIERYVGLEHITPEDLRIRSWGLVAEGTTFTNYFQPGQVLFGKRRAYQRKVAVADFDGVCSGDIYVLEPTDPNVLLPELLPFICQTEGFYEHAVGTSAGSHSPRTNWKQLSKYEFPLPPLDEQRRIVETLLSIEKLFESLYFANTQSNMLLEAAGKELFGDLLESSSVPKKKLRQLLRIPISNGIFRKRAQFGSGIPLVNVTDIYKGFRVNFEKLDLVPVSEKEYEKFSAKPNDVIFNRSSLVLDGIGHSALIPDTGKKMVFECHLMRARPDANLLYGPFLARYSLSMFGRRHFLSHAQTTTMTTINQGDLNALLVPQPDISTQIRISENLDAIEKASHSQSKRTQALVELKQQALHNLQG